MVQRSYIDAASESEAHKHLFTAQRNGAIRNGLWVAFLCYCVFGTLGFGLPYMTAGLLLLAGLYGFVFALPTHIGLTRALRSYKQSHGTLDGFSPEQAYATDLECTFTKEGEVADLLKRISHRLSEEANAKFYRYDASSGEFEAVACVGRPYDLLTDSCSILVRVSKQDESKATIHARITASTLTVNPKCDVLANIISSAVRHDTETATGQARLDTRRPLWLGRVIKSALTLAVTAVAGMLLHGSYAESDSQVTQLLKAERYGEAFETIKKLEEAPSYETTSNDKFVALVGLKRYNEAIRELDPNKDAELVAFAQADQGNIKAAEKALEAIQPGEREVDFSALYLAKAMIAHAKGDQTEALNDLAISRNSYSDLYNLVSNSQISLYKALGRDHDAREIEKSSGDDIREAKSCLAYEPWQFPICAIGLFLAFCATSFSAHRHWNKKPAGLPPIEKEFAMPPSSASSLFDNCLLALGQSGCTVINMDDEAGTLEASDLDGNRLVINLSSPDLGCKISVQSNSPKAFSSIERLRIALSDIA